ncbi:glutathione S-transferase family protein [Marinomonas sp. THO17]|uniref:glutathione S-transferase family protein n=1 Tax=Marinomonas sp. THO17 TaxID=3149048 RepID=UPI00336BB0D8
MKLVIGNKNYSSWSLRPWLLLHSNRMDFTEVHESLRQDNRRNRLGKYSGSCKVPVLIDRELTIWDSLAICEYISETYLEGKGWPLDPSLRATARSICAEMHAGFNLLRSELPMNCRHSSELVLSTSAIADVRRIESIWSEYAQKSSNGGLYLFGGFNIADCFYAPVALRFRSYGIKLSGTAAEYQESILAHPSVCAWVAQAGSESEVVPEIEV